MSEKSRSPSPEKENVDNADVAVAQPPVDEKLKGEPGSDSTAAVQNGVAPQQLPEEVHAKGLVTSCTIEVGRLTPNVTGAHLREVFGNFGRIREVRLGRGEVFKGRVTQKAYIEFENSADASDSRKAMNRGQIDGRPIVVAPLTSLDETRAARKRRSSSSRSPPRPRNRATAVRRGSPGAPALHRGKPASRRMRAPSTSSSSSRSKSPPLRRAVAVAQSRRRYESSSSSSSSSRPNASKQRKGAPPRRGARGASYSSS